MYRSVAAGSKDGYLRIFKPRPLSETLFADFTADSTSKPLGNPILFYDVSSGYSSNWHWDFGDGETSTEKNPIHLYKDTGCYNVMLISSDGIKTDTIARKNYINITNSIIAEFHAEPEKGPAPLTVKFYDESFGNPVSWKWNFGDGSYSEEQNPEHTFNYFGGYSVTLEVSNGLLTSKIMKKSYIRVGFQKIEGLTFENEICLSYSDYESYGAYGDECIQGGYLVLGNIHKTVQSRTPPYSISSYGPYNYMIRLENNFNTLWTSLPGASMTDGPPRFYSQKFTQTKDSIYVLASYYKSLISSQLLKMNDSGIVIFDMLYSLNQNGFLDFNNTKDGGFIILGYMNSNDKNTLILKINKNDSIAWYNTYKGNALSGISNTKPAKIINSNNGGYIFYVNDKGSQKNDAILNKIDDNGNIIWSKVFNNKMFCDMVAGPNNSTIQVGGVVDNNDIYGYISQVDSKGNVLWEYKNPSDSSYSLVILLGKSYILIVENLNNIMGMQLFNIKGKFIKKYISYDGYGKRNGTINSIVTTRDTSLFIVGTISPSSIYAAKVKIDSVLSINTMPFIPNLDSMYNITIIPNPFAQNTLISFTLDKEINVRLTIYDVLGQEITTLVNEKRSAGKNEVIFNGKTLPIGMYYCIINIGGIVGTYPIGISE